MDDLLMAVSSSQLRLRKDDQKPGTTDDRASADLRLMEFAFRMGQSASGNAAASSSQGSAAPQFPLLALEDDPNRGRPTAQAISCLERCLRCNISGVIAVILLVHDKPL